MIPPEWIEYASGRDETLREVSKHVDVEGVLTLSENKAIIDSCIHQCKGHDAVDNCETYRWQPFYGPIYTRWSLLLSL